MTTIPYILSMAYQAEIKEFCKQLERLSLDNFVMYIKFNNGKLFVLSSMSELLIPYYQEGWYQQDFSYHQDCFSHGNYYFCQEQPSVSENFEKVLKHRFFLHRLFYIRRICTECEFIFGAAKNSHVEVNQRYYQSIVRDFELFCIAFVEQFKSLILEHHVGYRNARVFNSHSFLKQVVQKKDKASQLTCREKQCLFAAMDGLSTKEVARELEINYTTVRSHFTSIREKLGCATIAECVAKAIYTGKIGCINDPIASDLQQLISKDSFLNIS